MKTHEYCRGKILQWDDLTEEEQKEFEDYETWDEFVRAPNGDVIGLNEFTRFGCVWSPQKNPIWSGHLMLSVWDGYFIRLNADGSEYVMCRRSW